MTIGDLKEKRRERETDRQTERQMEIERERLRKAGEGKNQALRAQTRTRLDVCELIILNGG